MAAVAPTTTAVPEAAVVLESESKRPRLEAADSPAATVEAAAAAAAGTKAAATAAASTSAAATSVLNQQIFTPGQRRQLRKSVTESQPYTHCVIDALCDPGFLALVRDEMINNIQATYKETDLFKVFQTGDLAALDSLDDDSKGKLPNLMRLREAVYSQEFRDLVQELLGSGPLSAHPDCSCNVYPHGGHLLCHDDVIGTRRVSYIIYLTDPQEPWSAADGGALELYPLVSEHTPGVRPSLCHLPLWNSMAMFVVQPGRSYHAVQEVWAEDKPRMSISGWFHAPCEPQEKEKASLQQLQMKAGQDNVSDYTPFSEADTGGALSDEDLAFLIRYINPAYLSEDAWEKIQGKFKEEGSIQLQTFLKKSLAASIQAALSREDSQDGLGGGAVPAYEAGVRDGWEEVGPPHKQRYLRHAGLAAAGSGPHVLAELRDRLFGSPAFARLLHKFTTIKLLGHTGEARRFRPGLDYTVAHYGVLTKDPRLDAVLCFADDHSEQAAAAWECGEVGGFEAYLLAEDDSDSKQAADVYRVNQDESGVLNVSAAFNSLNLVLRDEGLMKFVKYVSFQAPGSRWDVAAEYLPEDDSDDEEEQAVEREVDEAGEVAEASKAGEADEVGEADEAGEAGGADEAREEQKTLEGHTEQAPGQ